MFVSSTSLVVTGIAALAFINSARASPIGLIKCLEDIHSSKSKLITPSSSAYNDERLGFNLFFNFKPSAIYYPANNVDAGAAIKCAAANSIAIAPRSGGHSYEGYSEGGQDGALVIDLGLMQNFAIDKKTDIATVGAGFRLGPLYSKLWNNGQYLIPAGTCPSVGIGGHALGGGLGLTGRKYGMAADNIVGMTMIDANGNTLVVSASSHSDLFWALRGAGGGSFGLVTEFRIQAYRAPSKVTTMSINYPMSSYSSVIDAYINWGKSATEDIMAGMNVDNSGLNIQATFLGNRNNADTAIAKFLELAGKPSSKQATEGTWYEAATRWAWINNGTLEHPVIGDARYARGGSLVYRQPLSETEKDIIYKYLTNPPKAASASYIIIDIWGGKINRPNSPSAFDSHRGVMNGIEFVSEFGDSDSKPGLICPECLDWSAKFAKEMRAAYSSGPHIEAYQNYIERDLKSSPEAYYGSSLPRLKQIKKDIDPRNVFTFPQAIPLP